MKLVIIGGGIGGLATAISLQKLGIKAEVYERAHTFKPLGAGIGIGSNVMRALYHLGVSESILKKGMPLYEQRFLNEDFHVMNKIDFSLLKKRYGEETITVERADLHEALFKMIDRSHIHLNKEVSSFSQTADMVSIHFTDGTELKADYVIAADGLNSIFRRSLIKESTARYAGYTCWRGITKNIGDIEAHVSSEAWSKQGRFGFAPLYNDSVYWFACLNAREDDDYYKSLDKDGLAHQFRHFPPLVTRLIKETEDDYFLHHDIYDIKALSKFVFNRIALFGDAAHATTPNMGQGAGQAIEDAYHLMKAIKKTASMKDALYVYEKNRLNKTKKVINISRQIGNIAQWDHGLLTGMRDKFFPFIPHSLLFWRLKFLFDKN